MGGEYVIFYIIIIISVLDCEVEARNGGVFVSVPKFCYASEGLEIIFLNSLLYSLKRVTITPELFRN